YVNNALHKDKVLCKYTKLPRAGKKEAEIIKIIERNAIAIVGTYQEGKNFGFVVPDEAKNGTDIYIPKKYKAGAVKGHKVLVKIVKWEKDKSPEGRIISILGHINDPGVDILSICHQYNLPLEFSKEVLTEAANVNDAVLDRDKKGRRDLCDTLMVTIDGEDAKDLDDAVSLEIFDGYYRLGVHIADVTHYVREKTEIDNEAFMRGTSIYLVDRVIPMLPHKLSNGICSLNAGVERLALSCVMDIDKNGMVINHEVFESVILINERMSYTDVKQILEEQDENLIAEYESLVPMFKDMEKLAQILRDKRKRRGAIDFDFDETKVILDTDGHPVEIKAYDRNVATKLIEEFMLVCNETIAEEYYWKDIPFVYRIHENPDAQKIADTLDVINSFGYTLKGEQQIHPKQIQKLIDDIKDTAEESIIAQLILRSLKQAKYSEDCQGHFGLSARYYCHFTSPIRRYPDLQIHRIIKASIKGKQNKNLAERVVQVAKQSSMMERRAEEAERETIKLKKAEFMEDKVGQVFEGVINGVTSWGLYVLLPNTVEGLVNINQIDWDYYIFDPINFKYTGESSGVVYQLGDKVKVKLAKVNKMARTVDFWLMGKIGI
ncbi:MAG: ribonuclease R, partial [Epulopiscium sp. Nuni2H_MBin003]